MSTPWYLIAATLPEGNRIKSFINPASEGISRLLEDPPSFRWGGFDLRTGDAARLVGGTHYEVSGGGRKVLHLYQDGTLLFKAIANSDFLGWGVEAEQFDSRPRLNPVAIVEAHAAFVHLYARLIEHLVMEPAEVHFQLSLRNAETSSQQRLFLTRYYQSGNVNASSIPRFVAHGLNIDAPLTVSAAEVTGTPDVVAYKLIESAYSLFDAPPELIPFVKQVEGAKAFDLDALVALRG